jgi:hypothetical protein
MKVDCSLLRPHRVRQVDVSGAEPVHIPKSKGTRSGLLNGANVLQLTGPKYTTCFNGH